MKLTITTMTDLVFTLEVGEDMELENLKALCEMDSGIAAQQIVVMFRGKPLLDDKKDLKSYDIKDGDILLIQKMMGSEAKLMESTSSANALPFDFSSIRIPSQLSQTLPNTRTDGNNASDIRDMLLSNPEQIALLKVNNPRLAEALESGLEEFTKVLKEQQRARSDEERRRIRMLLSDPFDSEAQKMIADEIRQQQIDSNMETAMEYLPESFGQVLMLYIDCRVNGFPIKAFVDSGAQSTIMSKACAERCNIIRLIDQRWSGIAKGVGTQRIMGRIHLVQIQIGNDYLASSFTILEDQPMDMLLGLDMLKRHQCSIDLKRNLLLIGTTGTETPFLNENELPEFAKHKAMSSSANDDVELDEAIRRSINESSI
jgi:DNA damage-inducible protein 1